jgi:hypothetical protein
VTDYMTDPARSWPLGLGYCAVTGVGDDGTEMFLIRDERVGNGPMCSDGVPEHEQTGPLPPETLERIFRVRRCGAPTITGEPCRNPVDEDSQRCYHHDGGARKAELKALYQHPIDWSTVTADTPRCGAPKKNGCGPCRYPVDRAGDCCPWHEESTTPVDQDHGRPHIHVDGEDPS